MVIRKLFTLLLALGASTIPFTVAAQTFRYQDESGNLFFVEKLSDVPAKYQNQVIAPPPPPYRNEKEKRAWERNQAKLARQQAKLAKKEERAKKNSIGKGKNAGGKSPEEEFKQVQTVEVFTSPSCADCPKLEKFLKQNKIQFKKWDIVRNQKAFEIFDQLGVGSKLPVTRIGQKVIKGVQLEAILEAATQYRRTKVDEGSNTL